LALFTEITISHIYQIHVGQNNNRRSSAHGLDTKAFTFIIFKDSQGSSTTIPRIFQEKVIFQHCTGLGKCGKKPRTIGGTGTLTGVASNEGQ